MTPLTGRLALAVESSVVIDDDDVATFRPVDDSFLPADDDVPPNPQPLRKLSICKQTNNAKTITEYAIQRHGINCNTIQYNSIRDKHHGIQDNTVQYHGIQLIVGPSTWKGLHQCTVGVLVVYSNRTQT